ncbi:MAG: DUF3373 family protein [Acidobacteria bacterium]|nr:DUF3373 family protein [Acidobacteriota bacterium]
MRNLIIIIAIIIILPGPFVRAQNPTPVNPSPTSAQTEKTPTEQLRQEIELLKKTINALEERLANQEKKQTVQAPPVADPKTAEQLKDIDKRVTKTERDTALQRIKFGGDYRFEAHSIQGTIPAHFDGMRLQNLLVKSIFAMNVLGRPPSSLNEINQAVAGHYSDYQYFTNNLTFNQLKQAMGQFPAPLQQQLFGLLMPATYVSEYKANNKILYTNRFRIRLDAPVSENVSVTARLSMYKVFGDSTGVQVFNGQPTSLSIDGTTTGVPNSDILRVERAYVTWNKIANSPFFLSIGRRPSTDGPPLNLRNDEMRGGTPSGALIDYQFDGITFGYHAGEHTVLRLCYGLGYESGFGNGDVLKLPQDRMKDVHFLGGNVDVWSSEKTLIQATLARAFNVTDAFNGLIVLPNNPLTGETVGAPVIMRYTPSANLGDINLVGINVTHKFGALDTFFSANYVGLRPNRLTTPFGGLGSDPFEVPSNHNGGMIYAGARYNFGSEERTKIGFEFNKGSKYWFNFAQAEDDIIAPKTNTRGEVYQTYITHRITSRFIFKADFIRYNYRYSGSGWHLGAPKSLEQAPILGFPTYSRVNKFSAGLTARF